MHTPVSHDVPVYWQVHTCAMQAEVFISTVRCTLVDVLKLRLLCASTSALLRGPSSCTTCSYTASTLTALAALHQARTCHLCMQTRLRRRPRGPSSHSLRTFGCVFVQPY